jgi:hypothetical protein
LRQVGKAQRRFDLADLLHGLVEAVTARRTGPQSLRARKAMPRCGGSIARSWNASRPTPTWRKSSQALAMPLRASRHGSQPRPLWRE